jgi:drug/metabolite transporter (DMT)-like permease
MAKEREAAGTSANLSTSQSGVGGLLFASCFLYAANGEVLQFLGQTGATPVELLWLAHVMGLLLTPALIWRWQDVRGFFTMRFVLWMAVLSAILLCYNVMWLQSAARLPVRTTNLLFQTTIVITPLGAALLRLESLTGASALAAVLAMMGVALAAGPAQHDGSVHGDTSGVLFGLCAALGSAVYSILWKILGTKTAPFVATAYWTVSLVHLLALPAYPLMRAHGIIGAWRFPPTRSLQALLVTSAVLASAVNVINILIIAKAGAGVLAIGSAASIPIAFVLDLLLHSETPMVRELSGCSLIILSVGLTVASPDVDLTQKVFSRFIEKTGQGKESGRDVEAHLDDEADGSRRRRAKPLRDI